MTTFFYSHFWCEKPREEQLLKASSTTSHSRRCQKCMQIKMLSQGSAVYSLKCQIMKSQDWFLNPGETSNKTSQDSVYTEFTRTIQSNTISVFVERINVLCLAGLFLQCWTKWRSTWPTLLSVVSGLTCCSIQWSSRGTSFRIFSTNSLVSDFY